MVYTNHILSSHFHTLLYMYLFSCTILMSGINLNLKQIPLNECTCVLSGHINLNKCGALVYNTVHCLAAALILSVFLLFFFVGSYWYVFGTGPTPAFLNVVSSILCLCTNSAASLLLL